MPCELVYCKKTHLSDVAFFIFHFKDLPVVMGHLWRSIPGI